MSKWQSIETAPTRKGILVIAQDDEGEWFYPVVAWNWDFQPNLFNYEGWLAIVSERPLPFVPTHWMPIPDVPLRPPPHRS